MTSILVSFLLGANVLLIGDSITMGWRGKAIADLQGKAQVYILPENGRSTEYALEHLDEWTAQADPWRLIVVSWGLHDARFCPDNCAVPIDQYEANLRTLLDRLYSVNTSGTPMPCIIISTSTPIPDDVKPSVGLVDSEVQRYNEVMLSVVYEYQSMGYPIVVNDMYGFCKPNLEEWLLPRDIHYNQTAKTAQGSRMADLIAVNLDGCHNIKQLPATSPASLAFVALLVCCAGGIYAARKGI